MKKTPLKRGNSQLKKTALKKVSKNRINVIIDKVAELHKYREFYAEVWAKRPHICEVCGVYLGNELRSFHIEHLLEKSKYPQFTDHPLNIILTCLDCHTVKTNGHPKPIHKEKIEQAKQLLL